jgi:predicted transcriptional regulator
MEIKKAEEVMIPLDKYPHIPYWFSLRQAIAEMEKSELEVMGKKSLPRVVLVFDEKYRLMGMVRRRDLLRGLEPKFQLESSRASEKRWFDIKIDPELAELSYDNILKGICERAKHPVSDIMIPVTMTVNADDHLMKVIYEMVENNLSLLPVLKDNRIIGVVRSVDVFHEVAQLLL